MCCDLSLHPSILYRRLIQERNGMERATLAEMLPVACATGSAVFRSKVKVTHAQVLSNVSSVNVILYDLIDETLTTVIKVFLANVFFNLQLNFYIDLLLLL